MYNVYINTNTVYIYYMVPIIYVWLTAVRTPCIELCGNLGQEPWPNPSSSQSFLYQLVRP